MWCFRNDLADDLGDSFNELVILADKSAVEVDAHPIIEGDVCPVTCGTHPTVGIDANVLMVPHKLRPRHGISSASDVCIVSSVASIVQI